jgi:glycosyltransferase involved in cell wall biosynthesis
MRIAIYNRWLRTMGGGERDTGALAQVLASSHDVDLLTHEPVDIDLFAARLNVALEGVRLRLLPWEPDYGSVVAASAEYDLFVTASYLDMFVPRSPRKVLRVYFPGRPAPRAPAGRPAFREVLRRWLGGASLELLDGFHPPENHEARPFAWTTASARLKPARLRSGKADWLQLIIRGWRPGDAPDAEIEVFADGRRVAHRRLPRDAAWTDWRVPLTEPLSSDDPELEIRTTTFRPKAFGLANDDRELGIALGAARLFSGRALTPLTDRLGVGTPVDDAYPRVVTPTPASMARSYDHILTISNYVEKWVMRRWELPSDVVYPPVDVESFAPGEKRPQILSVGRFFEGSHNKKHLPMIAAFRALCDGGLRGWRFHLAGGCDLGVPEHAAYLERVRAAATGYPIDIHVNTPFAELRRLYAESRIFWHATGLGEDEDEDPDNFEHFGITTVEAMAAGCVPVVIAKAGQIEIVTDGESGLLWQTSKQLRQATLRLVNSTELTERLAAGARRRSRDFDLAAFGRSVRAALRL